MGWSGISDREIITGDKQAKPRIFGLAFSGADKLSRMARRMRVAPKLTQYSYPMIGKMLTRKKAFFIRFRH
jgi:hypothetical protein